MNRILSHTAVLLVATTLLSACQQGGGGYGYNENPNAYKGAAAGAALGGAAGALADDENRLKHAAIGAGVGALAGGAYGAYMDSQEQALRNATQGTGIGVTRQGNDLMLNIPSSITFAHDSSTIQSAFRPTLNNVASVLTQYPDTMIEVIGHTDSTGTDAYNLSLSDRRAKAVVNYLTHAGVQQRIIATGLGESQPIASNNSASGRAQNRRVEIKISPIS